MGEDGCGRATEWVSAGGQLTVVLGVVEGGLCAVLHLAGGAGAGVGDEAARSAQLPQLHQRVLPGRQHVLKPHEQCLKPQQRTVKAESKPELGLEYKREGDRKTQSEVLETHTHNARGAKQHIATPRTSVSHAKIPSRERFNPSFSKFAFSLVYCVAPNSKTRRK